MSINKITIEPNKKVFFTSDWHLSHINVIKYDLRPFENIYQMNNIIIENCNSIVGKNDVLIYLGDFSFDRYTDNIKKQINSINCKNIHFVYGNHDKVIKKRFQNYFLSFSDILTVSINKQEIVCSHYAMKVWNKSHSGSWHLYGHSHGKLSDDPNSLSLDVGVMLHDYKPLSFEQVKEIIFKKNKINQV